jgi:UDP-N-acetylglucosamine transferase subunit ALG13
VTSSNGIAPLPKVLVTLGMDHHPFNRMLGWVDRWLASGACERVSCLVQTGPGRCPAGAECRQFLHVDELEQAIRDSMVVACHAGPGSISLCLRLGVKPIVVPRLGPLGEAVDSHQVSFARKLGEEGFVEVAEDEGRFHELMNRAAFRGRRAVPSQRADPVQETVARLDRLVTAMLARR